MEREGMHCESCATETLRALDYACGDGGADCEAIGDGGSCYFPIVVAHASYAFNSYCEKNKRNGGTCAFGVIAMLINCDPEVIVIADSVLPSEILKWQWLLWVFPTGINLILAKLHLFRTRRMPSVRRTLISNDQP
ncbi:hypothetical protein DH2020_002171 [Rehmannia glutinosa]|uniref:X8 domain-containing protein n=1 Tax=Rehmannia glutinosa TaxID=99300 RepID=A0ABR0XTF5_REHGL